MRSRISVVPVRDAREAGFLFAVTAWLCLFSGQSGLAQTDPPANYYNTATGTGATLKSQLHNIIDNHTVRSYDAARSLLQITDAVPNRPGYMLLAYDEVELNVAAINPNGSIPGWDQAATWNREHTWPASLQGNSSSPGYSDLHQLRPTFTQTNSNRGNLSFGGAFGSRSGNTGTVSDGGTVWYPGNADAGRIARQQFYMAVRYDGSDSGTGNLELVETSNPGSNQLGKLSRMVQWHYAAPVDEFELLRNQRVFGLQNNRNPFIDRPEYVWSVFMDQLNDTKLTLAGGTTFSDGSSTRELDLGRVIVGASMPSAPSVTLSKAGVDGTYYEVTTSGSAFSDVTGRYNAFAMGAAGSKVLNVGLTGSTATPGTLSGSVTVNNLDVTTGLGSGFGALDGNDTINLSLDVLGHANPSFALDSDLNALTIDLGQATQFSELLPAAEFMLGNFGAIDDLMADLRLTGVTGSGDTEVLFLAPTSFDDLAVGTSRLMFAGGGVAELGLFSATYTLAFADENLPGASVLEPLTLNLLLEVVAEVPSLAGDFNGSGNVEQGDLDLVLNNWGGLPGPWENADGFATAAVDQEELDRVLNNWGSASAPSLRGLSVPEPVAGVVWMGALVIGSIRRRGLVA